MADEPENQIVEHATKSKGGTMFVRPQGIEQYYPLADYIKNEGTVYRRTVIVVSDWEEVAK
jgi:hypothetical protein